MDIDTLVSDAFLNTRNPVFDFFAVFVHYGLYIAIVLAAVLALYVVKKKKEFFILLNSLILSSAIVYIVKQIIQRARPDVLFNLLFMDEFSFPSGHTATAFVIATTMSYYTRRRNDVILFILAIFVGLSRIYLQAHYLTDVLAGAMIGVIASVIIRKYEKVLLKWEGKISKKMKSYLK